MTFTASEHARLVMAEAVRLLATGGQERAEEFLEATLEAVDSGHSRDIVAMLACSAVEAWTRYAGEIGEPAPEVLRVVFANWSTAEDELRAGGHLAPTS
jgi:hypothetical protein